MKVILDHSSALVWFLTIYFVYICVCVQDSVAMWVVVHSESVGVLGVATTSPRGFNCSYKAT